MPRYGVLTILGEGGSIMTRSCDEATAQRQERLSPGARRQSEVFAGAYDIAVQLIGLRERRGMTQAGLAAATGLDQGDISRIPILYNHKKT